MSNRLLSPRPFSPDFAALLLRLVFGGLFIYHGYGKLAHFNDILPHFGDIIGIGPKPAFMLVIFAEFFCGILVVLGCVTRLAVIPILITMAVAFFKAHAADEFSVKELAFLFMILSLVVFILGSGRYSVDRLLFKK